MTRQPVRSSNVRAVGYDPPTQRLEVEFHSGDVYRYEGVTQQQHAQFMGAPSKGKAVKTHLRGHQYSRV